MHGVAGDDVAGQVEFLHQLLHRGNLVGFLVDLDMGQNQRGIGRERAEHLPCLDIVEVVETALERLAVEGNDARAAARRSDIQIRSVFAEDLFDIRGAEPLQNVADRGMRRRPLPLDFEGFVQPLPMRLQISAYAAIRVRAAHHGENRKQQHVGQLVDFAFEAARVRDRGEQRKKGIQRLQGDLRLIRPPHRDSDFFRLRNRPLLLAHHYVGSCCIRDSVKSVEQPWSSRMQPTSKCGVSSMKDAHGNWRA